MANTEPILEVRGLLVCSREGPILRCDRLEVYNGDRLVFVGPSGAGKTLLCLAVLGLLRRAASTLSVTGKIQWWGSHCDLVPPPNGGPEKVSDSHIGLPGIGYVPQGTSMHFDPSRKIEPQAHALIRASCSSIDASVELNVNLRQLRFRDLNRILNAYPDELSAGMRQRVALAVALAIRPRILVLDEPTSALDSITRAAILARIADELETRACTLLCVSHRAEDAALLGARAVAVHDGVVLINKVPEKNERTENRNTLYLRESLKTVTVDTNGLRKIGEPIVNVQNVTVEAVGPHGSFPVLSECTFPVRAEERIGILGESGSGKTTLLRCIAGLIRPTLGQVEIDGRNTAEFNARRWKATRSRVQFVSQDPRESLNPIMTVQQCLDEPSRIHGHDHPTQKAISETCDSLGLSKSLLSRRTDRLSFGQRQRVVLLRLLLGFPKLSLILLDEPVSGLDFFATQRAVEMLMMAPQRPAMIVASHDALLLEQICSTVLVISQGRIIDRSDSQPWTFAVPRSLLLSQAARISNQIDLKAMQNRIAQIDG